MNGNFFKLQPLEQEIRKTKENCVENLKSKTDKYIEQNIDLYLAEARKAGLAPNNEEEFIEELKRRAENGIQEKYLELASELDKRYKP